MEIFEKPVKTKTIGFFMLLPATIILLVTIVGLFVIPAFGFASGVSFLQLIPFLILMIVFLVFTSLSIYVAIRYFKNKPFSQNKSLGQLFVFFSIGYFLYSVLVCVLNNLTGNMGGYIPSILSFFLLLILLPLGLGLKNGYK